MNPKSSLKGAMVSVALWCAIVAIVWIMANMIPEAIEKHQKYETKRMSSSVDYTIGGRND